MNVAGGANKIYLGHNFPKELISEDVRNFKGGEASHRVQDLGYSHFKESCNKNASQYHSHKALHICVPYNVSWMNLGGFSECLAEGISEGYKIAESKQSKAIVRAIEKNQFEVVDLVIIKADDAISGDTGFRNRLETWKAENTQVKVTLIYETPPGKLILDWLKGARPPTNTAPGPEEGVGGEEVADKSVGGDNIFSRGPLAYFKSQVEGLKYNSVGRAVWYLTRDHPALVRLLISLIETPPNGWPATEVDLETLEKSLIDRCDTDEYLSRAAKEQLSKTIPSWCTYARQASHWELESDFRDSLWEDFHDKGSSFIPVIGSAISDESGVPSHLLFFKYLRWVAYCVLYKKHDLQREGWPSWPIEKDWRRASDQFCDPSVPGGLGPAYNEILRLATRKVGDEVDEEADLVAIKEAWEALLKMLCRLSINRVQNPLDSEESGAFLYYHLNDVPSKYLISRFHDKMLVGCNPNNVHMHLVHLFRPMRIRYILDGNTDRLMERCLQDWGGVEYKSYDFEHDGVELQHETQSEKLSLIHTSGASHNGVMEVIRRCMGLDSAIGVPRHLFILSTKERDYEDHAKVVQETLRLADEALRGKDSHVYWVFYNQAARDKAKEEFAKYLPRSGEDRKGRLKLGVASRPELLLSELYSIMTHSLAEAITPYRYVEHVPPEADMPKTFDEERIHNQIVNEVVNRALGRSPSEGGWAHTDAIEGCGDRIFSLDGEYGVTSIASEGFWKLREQERVDMRCFWLSLNEFSDVNAIKRTVFSMIVGGMGVPQYENIVDVSGGKMSHEHISELQNIRTSSKRWVLFVYGRDYPGKEVGLAGCGWAKNDYGPLIEFFRKDINKLLQISVVFVPMTERRKMSMKTYCEEVGDKAQDERILKPLRQKIDFIDGIEETLIKTRDSQIRRSLPFSEIVKKAIGWCRHGDSEEFLSRAIFLYSICLFRVSRHMTVLSSNACLVGVFDLRVKCEAGEVSFDLPKRKLHEASSRDGGEVVDWVNELREMGFLRKQAGGSYWVSWEMREAIRDSLEKECSFGGARSLKERKAGIHFRIAEWYEESFRSCMNDSVPLIESFYHRWQALEALKESKASKSWEMEDPLEYLPRLYQIILFQIAKSLKAARPFIRLNLEAIERSGIFTLPQLKNQMINLIDWAKEIGIMGESINAEEFLEKEQGERVDFWNSIHKLISEENSGKYHDQIKAIKSCMFEIWSVYQVVRKDKGEKFSIGAQQLAEVSDNDEVHFTDDLTYLDDSPDADGAFTKVLSEIKNFLGANRIDEDKFLFELNQGWLTLPCKNISYLVRLCRLLAFLNLYNSKNNVEDSGSSQREESGAGASASEGNIKLIRALMWGQCARKLSWLLSTDEYLAQWEANLKTCSVASVCWARLGDEKEGSFFAEAHRTLNVAFGFLWQFRAVSVNAERGMLYFRRAQIFDEHAKRVESPHQKLAQLEDAWLYTRHAGKAYGRRMHRKLWIQLLLDMQINILKRVASLVGRGDSSLHYYSLPANIQNRIDELETRTSLLRAGAAE